VDPLDQPRFKELSTFSKLKVSSGVIVNLIPSTENKIEVYGDRYGGIVAKQKGNTLKLKMRLSELIHNHSIYVDLYFSQPPTNIHLNQGADVRAERALKNDWMRIKVNQGAQFEGEIKCNTLTTRSNTGGIIHLSGMIKEHDIKVSTGGICQAKDLISEYTEVKVFAGGEVSVYSENFVLAHVSMGGNIGIYGKPTSVKTRRTIAGEIYNGNRFNRNRTRIKSKKRYF
jgi:hypothetical protein